MVTVEFPRLWFLEKPGIVSPPFSPRSPRHAGILEAHPYSDVHGFITPECFLSLSNTDPSVLDWKRVRTYAEEMAEPGANFPIPFLQITLDGKTSNVHGHEGRHRAAAAMEQDLPAIPVCFWLRVGEFRYESRPREDDALVEDDPLARAFTQAQTTYIRSQDHGQRFTRPSMIRVVPMAPPKITAQFPRIKTLSTLRDKLEEEDRRKRRG